MAIYPKQLRFLLGSSLQQTSAPPCGALDRFRKFGLGRLAIKKIFFTFHVFDIFIVMLMYYLLKKKASFDAWCCWWCEIFRDLQQNENYSCRLSSVNVNCTYVCSIKLYWKGEKKKKKEIFRDQRYSVRKRLLVKHEDGKRDDFCNDFNFGFL